jgi:hypothetical protein
LAHAHNPAGIGDYFPYSYYAAQHGVTVETIRLWVAKSGLRIRRFGKVPYIKKSDWDYWVEHESAPPRWRSR